MAKLTKTVCALLCLGFVLGLLLYCCYGENSENRTVVFLNDAAFSSVSAACPGNPSELPAGYLLICGYPAPFNAATQTYYVPQSLKTSEFDGELSWSDPGARVYLRATASGKKELVSSGTKAELLIVRQDGALRRSVVFTGLPMLSVVQTPTLDTLYGKGDMGGKLLMFDPGSGSDYSVIPAFARISLRGNSTRDFAKKQYKLDFLSAKGERTSLSVFGLPADHQIRLAGMLQDDSRVRYASAAALWNALCRESGHPDWETVSFQYCELILNGEYYGLFGAMRDPQLAIDAAGGRFSSAFKVKGLLKTGDGSLVPRYTTVKVLFPENAPLSSGLTPLARLIRPFGANRSDVSVADLRASMNLENAIDFALFTDVLAAFDNTYVNFFLFCPADGASGYIKIPWDLDRIIGPDFAERAQTYGDDPLLHYYPFDIAALMEREPQDTLLRLSERYAVLRRTVLRESNIIGEIDSNASLLSGSGALEREYARWMEAARGASADALAGMEAFLGERLLRLDAYYGLG